MDAFLNKKYKLTKSENFDEFMKGLGFGIIHRKTAAALSQVTELTKDGDTYTLTMSTPLKNVIIKFKLGEEFEEERADGAKFKSVFTIDGNKLIQIQIGKDGQKITAIREFSEKFIITTNTCDGFDGQCTRTYELI